MNLSFFKEMWLLEYIIYTMAEKGHDCKHSPFFFYHYTRRFFPFKITLAVFFFRITCDVFFRDDAIITRDVFSMQYYTRRFFNAIYNYTRRFFNAIITRDVFFNAIITRDVFSMQYYTRRFFQCNI